MVQTQRFVTTKEIARELARRFKSGVSWYTEDNVDGNMKVVLRGAALQTVRVRDVSRMFGFKRAAFCEGGAMLFMCDYDLQSWRNLQTWRDRKVA
jgi:hypothetical protein